MVGTSATRLLAVVVVAGAGVVAVRTGRHAGALPSEVAASLPGDAWVPEAAAVSTQAIRIAAPPDAVWPWLVQMGYRRGGWYAIDALERLIGAGDFLTGSSADRVVPELQALSAGDQVPLSASLALDVVHLEPARALVLVLPDGPLAWGWSFTLWPVHDGDGRGGGIGTRLVVRTRTAARASWVRPLVPLLDAGHLVMQAVQLRRLRGRVEATSGDVTSDGRLHPR